MKTTMQCLSLPVALCTVLLTGCSAYVSRGIDDQGQAAEVVFPDIAADATLPEGTFPNLENLRKVGSGTSKGQLYDLLGRPHFREGQFAVREWDYVFNFRRGGETVVCQYKVIFDKAYLARSFYWKPEACRELLATAAPAPQVRSAVIAAPAVPGKFSLSADALFAFDRAELLPQGHRKIRELAERLKGASYERIRVTGHADRLGAADYNHRLSLRRAQAVRAALVAEGVPQDRVVAEGRGAGEPVVRDCGGAGGRAALVACLQPNRRVEIDVQGRERAF